MVVVDEKAGPSPVVFVESENDGTAAGWVAALADKRNRAGRVLPDAGAKGVGSGSSFLPHPCVPVEFSGTGCPLPASVQTLPLVSGYGPKPGRRDRRFSDAFAHGRRKGVDSQMQRLAENASSVSARTAAAICFFR